jgi:hypothetical protein
MSVRFQQIVENRFRQFVFLWESWWLRMESEVNVEDLNRRMQHVQSQSVKKDNSSHSSIKIWNKAKDLICWYHSRERVRRCWNQVQSFWWDKQGSQVYIHEHSMLKRERITIINSFSSIPFYYFFSLSSEEKRERTRAWTNETNECYGPWQSILLSIAKPTTPVENKTFCFVVLFSLVGL